MSNKSRRRAGTSRRLSMAAGALLAGAAIPIAAAGSAWADQTSDANTAPGVPIATAGPAADVAGTGVRPTSPDLTLSASQLESQYGLSTTEATAVSNAEFGNKADSVAPSAVEVSVDGKVIVDVNQGTGASTDATATSGAKNPDISIAIGGGSDSSASGAGALAFADGSSADGNSDKATAKGADATATINAGGTDATGADVKDVVTASGTNASASITDAGASKTTASGFDARATINANGADPNGVDKNDVATAAGTHSTASIADTADSKATASGFGARATIDANGADPSGLTDVKDVATAAGTHSAAIVQGSDGTTASATGTSSFAEAGNSGVMVDSKDVGTNIEANIGDSNVTVRAAGANAYATVDGSTNITATATGTNTNVRAGDDTTSQGKLTATGTGASVEASGDTGTVAVTAKGTDSYAWVDSSFDSSATSTNDPSGGGRPVIGYYTINGFANETGYAGVFDGTGSSASATGAGSTAIINPDLNGTDTTVTGGTATATNGGYAAVENDGTTLTSPVSSVAGDTAVASGPGSSADVVDSQTSSLTVNNGGSYEFYGVAGQTETNQSLGTPPPAETAPAPEVRLEPSIALP